MLKTFIKNVLNTPKKAILALAILILLVWVALSVGEQISSKWNALVFAYQKPAIVEVIRKDYDAKQSKLEQSYTNPDKSSEDKLVEAVIKKLQEESLK
jgi:hypothetical protein